MVKVLKSKAFPQHSADSAAKTYKPPKKNEIFVLKVSSIPYGFFEVQLKNFFSQFGHVVRVRVPRNKKTGNDKGYAYVGFEDEDVAMIACESMDNYLMFEKRLRCKVLPFVPPSMRKGKSVLPPPAPFAFAENEVMKMNKTKTAKKENKLKIIRRKRLAATSRKLAEMGIEYKIGDLHTSSTVSDKNVQIIDDDDEVSEPKNAKQDVVLAPVSAPTPKATPEKKNLTSANVVTPKLQTPKSKEPTPIAKRISRQTPARLARAAKQAAISSTPAKTPARKNVRTPKRK